MNVTSIEEKYGNKASDFKGKLMGLAAKSGKKASKFTHLHVHLYMIKLKKMLVNLFSCVIVNSFQIYLDNFRFLIMKYRFLTDAFH